MKRTLSVEQLREGRCVSMTGRLPMKDEHIEEQLQELLGWKWLGSALSREFDFPDYPSTIAFVNKVADIANRQNHHPTLLVTHGKVRVTFSTHVLGAISMNDFICAAQTNAILE